jgi:hypothetical protein
MQGRFDPPIGNKPHAKILLRLKYEGLLFLGCNLFVEISAELVALYHSPPAANNATIHREGSAEGLVGSLTHVVKQVIKLILPISL